MAREAAREGKREGIEAVAREKLARHRLRHPELHEALRAPRHVHLEEHGRSPRRHEPRGALEKALARGKKLRRQGLQVAQGVHDGLKTVHGTVAKGLQYAGHVEGGLEKAAALASVSSRVQRFELDSARRLRKVDELTAKGQTQEASLELMGLGTQVDEIAKRIREAKRLAAGNDKYEKEIAFYEEWQQKARASVHSAIAGGKDLGKQVGVSGQGISEQTHPDVFRNTRSIFAVQGKVIAFAGAIGDEDARPHVEKVLAEARVAKAELGSLQAKYKRDRSARDFLADGTQDRLIDESIAKLEKALHRGGKAEHKPATAPAAGARKAAEHGLAKLETLRKKAARTGRKLDRNLGKLEGKLHRGIAAGRKVEHGLEEVSRVTGALGDLFGDDSAIGHLADQVHDSADKGHDKLHGALQAAARGKKGLHEGRKLLEEALQLGAHRHVEKHAHEAHGGEGHVGSGHLDAPHREHLRGPVAGEPDGARAHGPVPHSDAHAAVEEAALAVAHFGGAVGSAVKKVKSLLERGRGAEAAERIRALEELSAHAAAVVKEAARAASRDPTLVGKAAELHENLVAIRAHFRSFVSGL